MAELCLFLPFCMSKCCSYADTERPAACRELCLHLTNLEALLREWNVRVEVEDRVSAIVNSLQWHAIEETCEVVQTKVPFLEILWTIPERLVKRAALAAEPFPRRNLSNEHKRKSAS